MYGYKYYTFYLNISRDELLMVYRGAVQKLRVRTDNDIILELDANHLRKFATNQGIDGRFRLIINQENKFVRLEQIG